MYIDVSIFICVSDLLIQDPQPLGCGDCSGTGRSRPDAGPPQEPWAPVRRASGAMSSAVGQAAPGQPE